MRKMGRAVEAVLGSVMRSVVVAGECHDLSEGNVLIHDRSTDNQPSNVKRNANENLIPAALRRLAESNRIRGLHSAL